jgi:hypothetical protein
MNIVYGNTVAFRIIALWQILNSIIDGAAPSVIIAFVDPLATQIFRLKLIGRQ